VLYLLVLLCGEFGVGWFISQVWGIELQQECPLHSDHIDCVTSDRYYIFSPMQKKPKSCDSQNHLTTQLFCSWEEVQKSRPVFIHSMLHLQVRLISEHNSLTYSEKISQVPHLKWAHVPGLEVTSGTQFHFCPIFPHIWGTAMGLRTREGGVCVCWFRGEKRGSTSADLTKITKSWTNVCWFNQN
jgi:hypothetical protein